jgi:hypothetical protein
MTAADGSYYFQSLVPGTYRIQEVQPVNFLDGKETVGTIAGSAKGTAGQDQIEVQLGANENGVEYNFGERGLLLGMLSMRMFLASTPPAAQIVTQINTPPTVVLSKSAAGSGYSTTYVTGGSPLTIAASDAAISDPDSPMLASMKVTITNLLDAGYETLTADVFNTQITSTYSNGVLTLSGVAELAVYEQVLATVKYSDTATSPQAGNREIDVVVNDGIANSQPAKAIVTLSERLAAIDQVLQDGGLL